MIQNDRHFYQSISMYVHVHKYQNETQPKRNYENWDNCIFDCLFQKITTNLLDLIQVCNTTIRKRQDQKKQDLDLHEIQSPFYLSEITTPPRCDADATIHQHERQDPVYKQGTEKPEDQEQAWTKQDQMHLYNQILDDAIINMADNQ